MDATLFGLIVADVIVQPMDVRDPPPPGGLHIAKTIALASGGNVCNAGIAMRKLGMSVAAAGMVGKDVLGQTVTDHLKHAGVDTSCVFTTEKVPTCATVVAVEPGGERCFWHAPGPTPLLDAETFRRCFGMFKQSAWVQIGYFGLLPGLTPDLPKVLAELRKAAPNTKIALDTIPPTDKWELLEPILPHLDLLAPSRTEAMTLTGKSEPKEMAAAFRRHMKQQAVIGIKLDKDGCHLDDGKTSATIPAYKIEVVDTTGAGDVWFGSLLTALIKKMPLEQAGKFANRAAADCCSALGTSAGVRTFDETLARI